MIINLHFNLSSGYRIRIEAESLGEEAILQLLFDMKHLSVEKDNSYHESYKKIKYLDVLGKVEKEG